MNIYLTDGIIRVDHLEVLVLELTQAETYKQYQVLVIQHQLTPQAQLLVMEIGLI